MSDSKPRRIIRPKALKDYIPIGATQLREHEASDPDFPQKVSLSASGRAVGYFEDEVIAYQEKLVQRRAARRNKTGAV